MTARTILVVDDEAPVRDIMTIALRKAGHHVASAPDGLKASQALKEKPFDLVITDLLMPDRDGLELIREIRRDYPQARIIATSGGGRVAGRQYLQLAKGMGAHAVLAKPFLPRDLVAAVENAFQPPSA